MLNIKQRWKQNWTDENIAYYKSNYLLWEVFWCHFFLADAKIKAGLNSGIIITMWF